MKEIIDLHTWLFSEILTYVNNNKLLLWYILCINKSSIYVILSSQPCHNWRNYALKNLSHWPKLTWIQTTKADVWSLAQNPAHSISKG